MTVESILGLIIFWSALIAGSAVVMTPVFMFVSRRYPKRRLGVPANLAIVLAGAGALWYAIPKIVQLLFG